MEQLIFYGSLMNLDLFYRITGRRPDSVRYGYVRGDLYRVTDDTEPHGIFNYPLLIPSAGPNIVICVEITLRLERSQNEILQNCLKDFEGDLFQLSQIEFCPFIGGPELGMAYVGKKGAIVGRANIARLECIIPSIYVWKFGGCV